MVKRKYTNIKAHESEIISMREAGLTRKQIADALELDKSQIKNWITRRNRKLNTELSESAANDYEREILLLKAENERLRSILKRSGS